MTNPLVITTPLHTTMETDNPQLISFLQEIRPKVTIEFQSKVDDLITYYQKK